ncbi:MAG: hypothetical protein IJ756_00290, partial [Paludibacteraceae bacterium]|nr:hypothetical protein [Paludibacteraceae bacterium]
MTIKIVGDFFISAIIFAYIKGNAYICTVKSAHISKMCTLFGAIIAFIYYDRYIIIAVHARAIEAHILRF